MVASEVCPAVRYEVSMRVTQVQVVTHLYVGCLTPREPDLAAVVPHIGVEVDALVWWLGGRQAPLHARPPGAVV